MSKWRIIDFLESCVKFAQKQCPAALNALTGIKMNLGTLFVIALAGLRRIAPVMECREIIILRQLYPKREPRADSPGIKINEVID